MAIDYSALQRDATPSEIAAFQKKHGKASTEPAIIFGSISLGFVALFTILTIVFIILGADDAAATVGVFNMFFFVGLIVTVLIVATSGTRYKGLTKMHAFALANQLNFQFDRHNVMYTGLVFQHGDSRSITESYQFPNGLEVGNYTYTTGSGRSRQVHYWGYARLKLPRKLPHMLLDAKKNNFLGRLSNLPVSLKTDQTMTLEGNFNDHFTLYVPTGYERDALYVFTPDVMASLIDHGDRFDIEVVDDNLFLYNSGKFILESEQEIRALLEVTDKISSEMNEQTDYYADERVANRSVNEIAVPGKRLKRGVSAAAIIIFILVTSYYFLEVILPLIWQQ